MIYCIDEIIKGKQESDKQTARSKAPDDILQICVELGITPFELSIAKGGNNKLHQLVTEFIQMRCNWMSLLNKLEDGDCVIVQHPYCGQGSAARYIKKCKRTKKVRFIVLIHDLYNLRTPFVRSGSNYRVNRRKKKEWEVLRACDYVICHNQSMNRYLAENGIHKDKLINLGIFDYLHTCEIPQERELKREITIAGNLSPLKCTYLYKAIEQENLGYSFQLFGPGFTVTENSDNHTYNGVCTPDELPGKLKGSFGLVWDGEEVTTCSGNAGGYLRYNNPHKCSLFLASNMPVIIWKEAALAPFVEENGVGITVDSLLDIGEAIEQLSIEEYVKMVENTKRISEKIRDGYYLKQSLKVIMES